METTTKILRILPVSQRPNCSVLNGSYTMLLLRILHQHRPERGAANSSYDERERNAERAEEGSIMGSEGAGGGTERTKSVTV